MPLFDTNTPDTQYYQTPDYAKGLDANVLKVLGYDPTGKQTTFGKVFSTFNPLAGVIGNKVAQGYANNNNLQATAGNIGDSFDNQMAKLDIALGVGRVAAGDLSGIGQVVGGGSALIGAGNGPNYNDDGFQTRYKTLNQGGIVTDGTPPTIYPKGSKAEDATVIDDETGQPLAKMRKGEMVISQESTGYINDIAEAYAKSKGKKDKESLLKQMGALMIEEKSNHSDSQNFYDGGIFGDPILQGTLTPEQHKQRMNAAAMMATLPQSDPALSSGVGPGPGITPLPPVTAGGGFDMSFGVPQLSPATAGISVPPIASRPMQPLAGVTEAKPNVTVPTNVGTPTAGGGGMSGLDANVLGGVSSGIKAIASAVGASKKLPRYKSNEAFVNFMRNLNNESQTGFSAIQNSAMQAGIDSNFSNEVERTRQLTSNGGTAASALAGVSAASQNRNAATLSKDLQSEQLRRQKQQQLGNLLANQESQNRMLYQQDIARLSNQQGAYVNAMVQNLDQLNQRFSPEGKMNEQYINTLFSKAKEILDNGSSSDSYGNIFSTQ